VIATGVGHEERAVVLLKASAALGVVALGAGMLVAAPAAAGTDAGAAFGLSSSAGVVRAAEECVGVAPTYADVMVRAPWGEKIEHGPTWLTQARYTRWVVDQQFIPGVPEVSHEETEWSAEPLAGWTATGESRYVVTKEAVDGTPEIPERTELRVVDPGQPYVAPTVELIPHPDEYRIEYLPEVWETRTYPGAVWYEFRQHSTGATRLERDPNWNAQSNPNSKGWDYTGNTHTDPDRVERVKVKDAETVKTLVREAWVEERVTDPGQEHIAPTYDTVVVQAYQPAVPAVPEQGYTELVYTRRVVTQEALPEVPEIGHSEEQWSAEVPGEGWEATGETRQVVDRPAWTEKIDHPAVFENQMVDPGVVCPGPGGDTGGVGDDTGGPATPGGSGGTPGGRPGAVVTVPVSNPAVNTPVVSSQTGATPSRATVAATLPSTGANGKLLAVAGLAVTTGAALLGFRAWAARIADGSGRHRSSLARGAVSAGTSAFARWRPFRRRAHRRAT